MDQDQQNLAAWLQQALKEIQETRNQIVTMHSQMKQATDEIRAVSSRMDQKDSDILRLIDNLRAQLDILRGGMDSTKTTVESNGKHLSSKIDDVKSSVHEVRNRMKF